MRERESKNNLYINVYFLCIILYNKEPYIDIDYIVCVK